MGRGAGQASTDPPGSAGEASHAASPRSDPLDGLSENPRPRPDWPRGEPHALECRG